MEYQLLLAAGELGYDPELLEQAAVESDYGEPIDQRALANDLLAFRPPYRCDPYDHIKWCEFCRAVREYDFMPGDEFTLNGIHFKVEAL